MKPSRFEKRILVAMTVVAIGSVLGGVAFGYAAVGDAYRTGVNDDVVEALEEGVLARRAHLVALRELCDRTLNGLANDRALYAALRDDDRAQLAARIEAELASAEDIERIAVLRGEDEVLVERARPSDTPMRRLERSGEVHDVPDVRIEVTTATPEAAFRRFEEAGELAEIMRRLSREGRFVEKVYLQVYVVFVSLIALASLLLGAWLSRRVTRTIGVLVAANRRLGSGDLSVDVPVGSDDEIGELTRSFNAMVRDMRETSARVEYLQRISAWQEFARRLAHEIKNPLTPIQLASQEIRRSYRGDDEAYRAKLTNASAIIEEEVATLRRLVGEFSNFARLPTARLEVADVRDFLIDFERTLPGLLEDVHTEAGEPVVVDIELPEPTPARIDAMMLRRCLDNLVRNAAQATAHRVAEGGRGHVRVRVARAEGKIAIRVEDEGPGIAPEDREKVFDPYFTTKAEGTGLGLAIVKKVALEHGGHVEVTDSPLGGACFVLTLPAHSSTSDGQP